MEEASVKGSVVDNETRCVHYHSPQDIIAIRFKCCGDWYPCIHCHEESAQHEVLRWPRDEWNVQAILCGVCKTQLTIEDYFKSDYSCPACGSAFNPRCSVHDHFYFEK